MLTRPASVNDAVRRAADAGRRALLDLQHADGYWEGVVRSDPAVTAQFLLMARYVDRSDPATEIPLLAHLDRAQLPSGGWAGYPGGPSSLDVSLLCYAALRFAGRDADSEPMRRARGAITAGGGIEGVGFIARFPLVAWGQVPLSGLTYLSPKLLFLPPWIHPNLQDLGILVQAVLPVELLLKRRAAQVPPTARLMELHTGRDYPRAKMSAPGAAVSWLSKIADTIVPAHWLDRRAADWLADRQNSDGLWAGMGLFTTRAVMALHATDPARYREAIARGVAGMTRLQVPDGETRWQQLGHSPVLDTAIAAAALLDAGVRPDDARLTAAFRWLLAVRAEPGGWSFAPENRRTPDTDTTLHVLEALVRAPRSLSGLQDAVNAGLLWLVGMQNRSGGWAMWSANLQIYRSMIRELELNRAMDVSTPDVTARVVRALARLRDAGLTRGTPTDAAITRALVYLKELQRTDGSWPGRWAVNFSYGAAQGLTAMAAAGDRGDAATRARQFLRTAQRDDGGWGESPASDDAGQLVPAASTATQTSLAMLGLLTSPASHPHPDASLTRGAALLLERQRDGTWDDDAFCQTVLPGKLHFQNSLLPTSLAVMTLSRFARGNGATAVFR